MKARTKNNEDMRNLTINADPEVVKDTFFSWNGRAVVYMNQAHSLGFKFGRDGSPYVMNKYDDLRNPDKNPSGWGQVKRDHGPIEYSANDDAGAFVIYRELMELAGTPIGDASGVRLELPAPPAVAPKTQEEIDCDNKMSKEVSDVKRGLMDKYNCVSGKLEPSELAALGGPWGDNSINPIGLEGFKGLAAAYQAEFGKPLKVNDSYRSYDEQVQTKAKKVKEGKPNEAASPGKSTHGWGFALDLGDGIERFDSPQHKWMKENAHKFGWIHPAWAEPNGSAPEAWHWEFAGPQEAPQPSAQAQPQANKNTAPTTPEVEIKPSTNPSPTPPTTDDKKADDKKKSNAPEDNPKTNDNADKKDQKPQDNDKQNKQNDNKFWDLLSFGD
ncbi:D-alanyl-D-alanine carboxypeptidase family protein [Polaromonas sp.]|nr:D-alanyl-D-alanine carboxypeptidase family protein [Candidatus Saccharibacteria bacterium]